jgi:lipoprotein-anchoring transpeptidase ErfK/SrfK
MSNFTFRGTGVLFVTVMLLSAGCTQNSSRTSVPNNTVSNINNAVNSNTQPAPAETQSKTTATVLTLPMLDALMADNDFVSEARSSLQITDEEIDKLKNAARDAVLKLSDDPSEDNARSTKAAADAAKKQLQQVLGADRANRFMQLVDKYAGNQELANSAPNQVPTDTRVVVNAPAYRMDIFDKGKLVQTYKVGIGYPEFPLPTGLRQAKSLIFNPTWTPPDEPWVKGKFAPGKTVEAGSKLNPLGPIKIPIGLPNLIHGGKSPSRLGTFASHGCVGLTNPMIEDFAAKLTGLLGDPLSVEDIKGYEKAKTETKEVKLKEAIPVELRYETIVVEDGTLKIYRDVYERGTNTEENLKRVLDVYGVSLDDLQPDLRSQIIDALSQMAVDATGNPVDTDQNNNSDKDKDTTSKKGRSNKDAKVTKDVKGQKVLEFKIPQLAGKGYPAPVGLKA